MSGAIVAVLALVVALTPFRAVPAFASLPATPDPTITGTVAYVRGTGDGRCVVLVAASGERQRQVACRRQLGLVPDSVLWNAAGNLVVESWQEAGLETVEISPETGAVVSRGLFQELEKLRPEAFRRAIDGAILSVDGVRAGRARVVVQAASGEKRTVFEVEGPIDYRFYEAMWSPDGRYALVQDSEQRVLIVDVDVAQPTARVLATDASSPAWGTYALVT